MQPPPILSSGIPHHSVIITSHDDAPRTQKFVISISGESFHILVKSEQSFQQAIDLLAASFGQLFQFSNIQATDHDRGSG